MEGSDIPPPANDNVSDGLAAQDNTQSTAVETVKSDPPSVGNGVPSDDASAGQTARDNPATAQASANAATGESVEGQAAANDAEGRNMQVDAAPVGQPVAQEKTGPGGGATMGADSQGQKGDVAAQQLLNDQAAEAQRLQKEAADQANIEGWIDIGGKFARLEGVPGAEHVAKLAQYVAQPAFREAVKLGASRCMTVTRDFLQSLMK